MANPAPKHPQPTSTFRLQPRRSTAVQPAPPDPSTGKEESQPGIYGPTPEAKKATGRQPTIAVSRTEKTVQTPSVAVPSASPDAKWSVVKQPTSAVTQEAVKVPEKTVQTPSAAVPRANPDAKWSVVKQPTTQEAVKTVPSAAVPQANQTIPPFTPEAKKTVPPLSGISGATQDVNKIQFKQPPTTGAPRFTPEAKKMPTTQTVPRPTPAAPVASPDRKSPSKKHVHRLEFGSKQELFSANHYAGVKRRGEVQLTGPSDFRLFHELPPGMVLPHKKLPLHFKYQTGSGEDKTTRVLKTNDCYHIETGGRPPMFPTFQALCRHYLTYGYLSNPIDMIPYWNLHNVGPSGSSRLN